MDIHQNVTYHNVVTATPVQTTFAQAYALSENFPNPFNPETVIRFTVPDEGDMPQTVTLAVYNARGQEVKTLIEGDYQPGTYQARWDGTDGTGNYLQSGIYFCRMRAGDFMDMKKMVLLR